MQGVIFAKGFTDDFRYAQQQRIQRMKKVHLRALPNGVYIYGFRLLNIGLLNLYECTQSIYHIYISLPYLYEISTISLRNIYHIYLYQIFTINRH